MHQSTTGERLTAAVSTLVAIAILGAAVTAQQARAPQGDRLASLESDVRYQFNLAYRHDRPTHHRNLERFNDVLDAWQASPRSAADDQLLERWMREAIAQSMPGRGGELPPAPTFGATARPPVAAPPRPPQQPAHDDAPIARSTPNPRPTVPSGRPAPSLLADMADVAVEGGPNAGSTRASEPTASPIVSISAPEPLPASGGTSSPASSPVVATPKPEAVVTQAATEPAATAPAQAEHSVTVRPAHSVAGHEEPASRATTTPADPTAPPLPPPPVVATEPNVARTASAPAVRINLRELTARINGYHQDLGDIEAATVVDGRPGGERLETLVGRLESLAGKYQLIRLYYDSLTPAERQQVAEPRPMGDVIELVNRHLSAADDVDIFAEFTAEDAEQSALDKRLQAVARAVGALVD